MSQPPEKLKSCCADLYAMPIVPLLLGESFHPGGRDTTGRLGAALALGRGSRVLDVASGRGESARFLADRFGCSVVGVEYSNANVAAANELAGKGDRLRFVQGDAERLEFDDGEFDAVLCECSLCLFPDMEQAARELLRVLRPGGRIGLSDMVMSGPLPDELQGVLGHVLCISHARSAQGYVELLSTAGFSAVRVTDVRRALEEMVELIERRWEAATRILASGGTQLPPSFESPGPVLASARKAIREGIVGYALFTGRKPRTS